MDRRRESAFAMGRSTAGGQAETAEQERGLSRQPAGGVTPSEALNPVRCWRPFHARVSLLATMARRAPARPGTTRSNPLSLRVIRDIATRARESADVPRVRAS